MTTPAGAPATAIDDEIRLLTARLNRARTHYVDFAELWEDYLASRPHSITHELLTDGTVAIRLDRVAPIPAELSIVLGEFLYEMRAALDNCLYAAAVITSGENPPPGAERLEWPIRSDHSQWKSQASRYQHLPDELIDVLEAIQPYNAELPAWNCLAILHDLARVDRHRSPRPLALFLVRTEMRAQPGMVEAIDIACNRVINPGEVLARLRIADGHVLSPTDFDFNVEFEVDVADIEPSEGPKGLHVRPWGSLAHRLQSVHRAVTEYCDALLDLASSCRLDGGTARTPPGHTLE